MDGLVASYAENGGAENRVGVAVDNDFHKSLRFPLFDRAADAGHGPAADPDRVSFGARFGLGHADPAERRIDVERVNRNAVAHLARGAVEQVRRGDLEIVVRGMGEGAAAVAIAERPDVGNVGLQRTRSTTI